MKEQNLGDSKNGIIQASTSHTVFNSHATLSARVTIFFPPQDESTNPIPSSSSPHIYCLLLL